MTILKKLNAMLIAVAFCLILANCGKESPKPADAKLDSQPAASNYFQQFTFAWGVGSDLTGGKAQYAQSNITTLPGGQTQAKLDYFQFKDGTFVVEYWEVTGVAKKQLQGLLTSGKWYVNDAGKLILLDPNQNRPIAEGSQTTVDGVAGISLVFNTNWNVKAGNNQLNATGFTQPWTFKYAAQATQRTLPANPIRSLPGEMDNVNTTGKFEKFPD